MKTNQLIYAPIKTSKVTGNLRKLIRTSKEIEKKQLKYIALGYSRFADRTTQNLI